MSKRTIGVPDPDGYYTTILEDILKSKDYELKPHEKSKAGLVKFAIDNLHILLDEARKS